MVSGLVTSPCDQLRIFSGEARLMRMASKSAIAFARSKGLERYKGSSTSCGCSPPLGGSSFSGQWSVASGPQVGWHAGACQCQLLSSKLLTGASRIDCVNLHLRRQARDLFDRSKSADHVRRLKKPHSCS